MSAMSMPARSAVGEGPAQAEAVQRFDVLEFEIAGNTVLPDGSVEKAVYRYLGESRTLDDVEGARAALEQTYRDAGYQTVSVTIPEQRVGGGVVRLEVAEASIGRTRVVGARYYEQGRILAQAPSLEEGRVPNFPDLQRDIEKLNRAQGARIVPVLRAGRTPGTTDVDLNVEDRPPLGGSIELNNNYSPNTDPLRLAASANYDNLFQQRHSFRLQFLTAPADVSQSNAISGSYLIPLGGFSRYLAIYAVRSRSNVAALGTLTTLGRGDIVGARFIQPLPGRDSFSHSITLGLDYKNFKENVVQPGELALQTPIRYWPASLNYSLTANDESGSWLASTGVVLGLRGAGSPEIEFENKRFLARGNFFVYKWELQRNQKLLPWLSATGRVDGQLADQPLISNEQYFAGGATSVRGYLQSEVLGDDALRGSLELTGPSLAGTWAPAVTELRPFVFVDAARLRVRQPLPAQQERFTLASAGLGFSMRASGGLTFGLHLAWPFRDTRFTSAGDTRLQFRALYEF